MVEQVEELDAELRAIPLLEREVLEHGEVHVLEATVAEGVSAHISEAASCWRSHGRLAIGGYEAAEGRKIAHAVRIGLARGPHGGRIGKDGACLAEYATGDSAAAR